MKNSEIKNLETPSTLKAFHPLLFLVSLCLGVLVSFTGCFQGPKTIETRPEADQKLQTLIKEDFGLHDAVITSLKKTLYIYVPITFDIFEYKASQRADIAKPKQPAVKRQINYLDVSFEGSSFVIEYDISPIRKYPKSPGYGSGYSDAFSRLNNNILSAIFRAYGDLSLTSPDFSGELPPTFIVTLITDVRSGIGIKATFAFSDLKKVMTQSLGYDEYYRRYITDIIGDTALVADHTGKSLKTPELTWPEFLRQQIQYRITFNFTRSAFPPEEENLLAIKKAVATSIKAYEFTDFAGVVIENIVNGSSESFSAVDIAQTPTDSGKTTVVSIPGFAPAESNSE